MRGVACPVSRAWAGNEVRRGNRGGTAIDPWIPSRAWPGSEAGPGTAAPAGSVIRRRRFGVAPGRSRGLGPAGVAVLPQGRLRAIPARVSTSSPPARVIGVESVRARASGPAGVVIRALESIVPVLILTSRCPRVRSASLAVGPATASDSRQRGDTEEQQRRADRDLAGGQIAGRGRFRRSSRGRNVGGWLRRCRGQRRPWTSRVGRPPAVSHGRPGSPGGGYRGHDQCGCSGTRGYPQEVCRHSTKTLVSVHVLRLQHPR